MTENCPRIRSTGWPRCRKPAARFCSHTIKLITPTAATLPLGRCRTTKDLRKVCPTRFDPRGTEGSNLLSSAGESRTDRAKLGQFGRRFWAMAARWNSSRAPNGPRSPQPVEPQNAFEVHEHHLDLFSLIARGLVGIGLGDLASEVARPFVDRAQHLAAGALA